MTNDDAASIRKDLATQHGYDGEAAETFASLIKGESVDAMTADAARLANLFGPAEAKPAPMRAIDPSQGKGMETPSRDVEMKRFADSIFDRILYRQPGGWR